MKKALLSFVLLILLGFTANAQVLFEENFDYTTGTALTDHGWSAHSGGTTNPILVTTPGLTYTGYPSSGIGNAASIVASGQDVNKPFDSTNTGVLYASCLVNVTSAPTYALGDYFFHFSTGTISTIFMGRLFVKQAANGNLAFGLSKSSTNTATVLPAYSDSVYTTGTTYLLIVKYVFNSGANDDSCYLFINPVISGVEPAPSVIHGLSSNNDPSYLGTICIRQGSNSPALAIDGIRVGRTWASVVPVELTSFTASVVKDNVTLNWTTATETNNQGFSIERKSNGGSWTSVAFIPGAGTSTQVKNYSYTDRDLANGTYQYRLKQTDFDGSYAYSKSVEAEINNVISFELSQNYPNPFNPATTIKFSVPQSGNVTLKVYNMLGQEVAALINEFREAGTYTVNFRADNLMSGVYLYKIEAGNYSQVKKMTLLK